MMKYSFFALCLLGLLSCYQHPDSTPASFVGILMYSDSTSVITSDQDKVIIEYNDGDLVRQLYSVDIFEQDTRMYGFSSIEILGVGEVHSTLYLKCKGKTDTLVFLNKPPRYLYDNEPLHVSFNGKDIYIPSFEGEVHLVR